MNVDDVVAARIAAARLRAESAKRARAARKVARDRGLAQRHAAKLRAQAARRPEPAGVATPQPEENTVTTTTDIVDPLSFVPGALVGPYSHLAYRGIHTRAVEAYDRGLHDAAHQGLDAPAANGLAIDYVLGEVGRAYAAAALHQAALVLTGNADEDALDAVGDIAATLDLDVIDDLTGANGVAEVEPPEVRVFHNPNGWTLPVLSPDVQDCTTNHIPDYDGPACTDTAVWKVARVHPDMGASIGFWCDTHLPAEHRPTTGN